VEVDDNWEPIGFEILHAASPDIAYIPALLETAELGDLLTPGTV